MRRALVLLAATGAIGAAAPAAAQAYDLAGVWSDSGLPLVRVDETPPGTFEGRNQLDFGGIGEDCEFVQQQAIWNDVKRTGTSDEFTGKAIVFSREASGCFNREVNAWFWIYPGGSGKGLRVCVPKDVGPGHDDDAPAIDKTSSTGLTGINGCTDFGRFATRAQNAAKRTAKSYVGPITRRKCSKHGLVTYDFDMHLSQTAVPSDPVESFRIYFRGKRVKAFSTIFRGGKAGSHLSFANLIRTKPGTVKVIVKTARLHTYVRSRFFSACFH
jgi:hypothetical protein